jgi:hypothetical protein
MIPIRTGGVEYRSNRGVSDDRRQPQLLKIFGVAVTDAEYEVEKLVARAGRPLNVCPVCLRKLCWDLRVEPERYLTRPKTSCVQNGFNPERGWYGGEMATLAAWGAD